MEPQRWGSRPGLCGGLRVHKVLAIVAMVLLLAVLAYAWIIYPLIVVMLGARRKKRPTAIRDGEEERLPDLVILLSAHNEERVIRQRLENLDRVDYPKGRLKVLVGVDGGTDHTASIAEGWAQSHPTVRVCVAARNRGKAAMLKRLVTESQVRHTGEAVSLAVSVADDGRPYLLVFTDANTVFESDALRRLVAPFADAAVGGVCGRLAFRRTDPAQPGSAGAAGEASAAGGRGPGTGEPVYWDAETRMKTAESAIDSCLGANGAIYAIRSELFPHDFRDNTIVDDFVLGMKVREQGYRMVFESEAVAYEELPATVQDEWRRRVRIGAGAYQALTLCWRCLLPRYGVFAWMFWSHKVLRWVTPHLGVLLLAVSSGLLVAASRQETGVNRALLCIPCAAGVAVCLMGVAGWFLRNSPMSWTRPLRLLGYFLAMQMALFAGFLRFCRGNLSGAWERTERRDEPV